jgi:hypothetical protein
MLDSLPDISIKLWVNNGTCLWLGPVSSSWVLGHDQLGVAWVTVTEAPRGWRCRLPEGPADHTQKCHVYMSLAMIWVGSTVPQLLSSSLPSLPHQPCKQHTGTGNQPGPHSKRAMLCKSQGKQSTRPHGSLSKLVLAHSGHMAAMSKQARSQANLFSLLGLMEAHDTCVLPECSQSILKLSMPHTDLGIGGVGPHLP